MMSLWNSYKRLGDSFVRVSFDKYAIQINAHRKKHNVNLSILKASLYQWNLVTYQLLYIFLKSDQMFCR